MVVATAFLLRVACIVVLADLHTGYYWEYGEIAKNLLAGKGYSLYHVDDSGVVQKFSPSADPFPSAYMPPGYVFFIWIFLHVGDVVLRNWAILIVHALSGSLACLVVHRFTRDFFDPAAAMTAAVIAAVFPEFIYATLSFTPTVLYHFGIMVVLYLLFASERTSLKTPTVGSGIMLGLLSLLRFEVVLFAAMIVLRWMVRKDWKKALMVTGIVGIMLLPWQIRNILVFGEFVPLGTSAGLNFFRGHNTSEIGAWGDEAFGVASGDIRPAEDYEVRLNEMYFRHAIAGISGDAGGEISRTLEKISYLWTFRPGDQRSMHVLYLFPWLCLLVPAVAGWGMRKMRVWSPVGLFFVYSTFLVVIFFPMPRYQTMMKIALVPIAALPLSKLWEVVVERCRRVRAIH